MPATQLLLVVAIRTDASQLMERRWAVAAVRAVMPVMEPARDATNVSLAMNVRAVCQAARAVMPVWASV